MTKRTILFLAADPNSVQGSGLGPRVRRGALDHEASAIHKELKGSGYRDRFELVTRWAAEPNDLLRALRELKPAVVHFSGHGEQDGLLFHGPHGEARRVSPAAIAETFDAAGGSVRLVVLSACCSRAPAEALLAHVDCVVWMSGVLPGNMARAFAIGFYGALGEQESVAAAYRHGNAAISLEGLAEAERPQLGVRAGADAAHIVLAAIGPAAAVALPCPYPGMRPYSADDADHFHGRGAEIEELLGRLRAGEREIYVLGPSGSGKSSLVTAGLLPRLARGAAGLGRFVVRSMRPGEHPAARLDALLEVSDRRLAAPADAIAAIAALLAGLAPSSSVLILIDQLEELFTLAEASERDRFLRALAALQAAPRCVVIFTLRADFFGTFMESPLCADRRNRLSRVEVYPLRGAALNEAIARPAGELGVSVEPELIERLLADAGSEPGVLPLLQETLVQLWDRRRGQTLMLADYQMLGDGDRSGLAVALARRADALLRELTVAQEAIARRILIRLISFGEGRSDTRRQQPRSSLRAAGDEPADFDLVLRRLTEGRLLTADDGDRGGEARVDLAHEVMIGAWPKLAAWIQAFRGDEHRRRQLEAAAGEWAKRGRGAGGLLDPIELAEAETWQETDSARELGQSAEVAALITASRAARDRQRRRRRGLLAGAFAVLAIFAVVVGALAVMASRRAGESEDSRRRAEDSRRQAEADRTRAEASDRESQRLLAQQYKETGRQLLLDGYPQEAMPYLMATRERGEDGESLQMLISMATHSLPLLPALAHQDWVNSAAFSPDGTRLVTTSRDHTARIWDAVTGKPLGIPVVHRGWVNSAAFSPDGTRVITASSDSTARIWNAFTGKLVGPLLAHQGGVNSAAFSPDGTRVVTASDDRTARVWDAATGRPLGTPLAHQDTVVSAAFSPDGSRIVTSSLDHRARVWSAVTGKLLGAPLAHQDAVVSAAFSPDGTRVVTASRDHTARVWDAFTGRPLGISLAHEDAAVSAAFSPDGARVVTASLDHTARVWDAATGEHLGTPLAHQDAVVSVAFSPDGTRVITASLDNTAQVWDAATRKSLGTPLAHQDAVVSATFSPDGARVVTASRDHTARIWDVATGAPVGTALAHQDTVVSATFSADGTRVVTASRDHTARIWDAATGQPRGTALAHQAAVVSATFSPDGTRVVTASSDHTARIWDAATGTPLGTPLAHQDWVNSAVFSPDGTCVVTASRDHTARVWDTGSGKPLGALLVHQDWVNSAAFSPDGTRVVTASLDHTVRLWDTGLEKSLGTPLARQDWVNSAAFSPGGTRVVTASRDHTARIWDAATGKPLGIPLTHQGEVWSAAFSPDGTRVVTASDDKTARIWEIGLDKSPPKDWPALAARSPFVLRDGVHVLRSSLASSAGTP